MSHPCLDRLLELKSDGVVVALQRWWDEHTRWCKDFGGRDVDGTAFYLKPRAVPRFAKATATVAMATVACEYIYFFNSFLYVQRIDLKVSSPTCKNNLASAQNTVQPSWKEFESIPFAEGSEIDKATNSLKKRYYSRS